MTHRSLRVTTLLRPTVAARASLAASALGALLLVGCGTTADALAAHLAAVPAATPSLQHHSPGLGDSRATCLVVADRLELWAATGVPAPACVQQRQGAVRDAVLTSCLVSADRLEMWAATGLPAPRCVRERQSRTVER